MNPCAFLSGLRLQPPCSHTKKCCFCLGSKSHVNQMSLQIGKNQHVSPGKAGELQPPTSHETPQGIPLLIMTTAFVNYLSLLRGTCYLPLLTGKLSPSPLSKKQANNRYGSQQTQNPLHLTLRTLPTQLLTLGMLQSVPGLETQLETQLSNYRDTCSS